MTTFLIHDDWLNRSPAVFALTNRHTDIFLGSFLSRFPGIGILLGFSIDVLISVPFL